MILIDSKNGISKIDGTEKDIIAELIYIEKTVQNEWRKKGIEDLFKRIIKDSLDSQELESIMKGVNYD